MLGDCAGPEDSEQPGDKVACHCCALEVPWLLLGSAQRPRRMLQQPKGDSGLRKEGILRRAMGGLLLCWLALGIDGQ